MTATPDRCRSSAPPMCIRHELSAAQSTSAPLIRTAATLSAQIAADTSGFFTANVPPNPQHVSASGRSARSRPRTARSSRSGASPTLSIRSEWQLGWYVTRCGKYPPTSVTPSTSARNTESSWVRGATSATARARPGSPASAASTGKYSLTMEAHEADGVTTASKPPNAAANPRAIGTASRR